MKKVSKDLNKAITEAAATRAKQTGAGDPLKVAYQFGYEFGRRLMARMAEPAQPNNNANGFSK